MTTQASAPNHPERTLAASDRTRLQKAAHATPHDVLGAHPAPGGCVVRAFHPDAQAVDCLIAGGEMPMTDLGDGIFAVFVAGAKLPLAYRLRFRFADGSHWERGDPYRFLPTIGAVDCYLFNEGTHRHLWHCLGAHLREIDGEKGVAFAVWAPSACRVSVVGDFCRWDGRLLPMRAIGSSGVFEIFVPGIEAGVLYKFEILTAAGTLRLKADPFAFATERPPGTASRVLDRETYDWQDGAWMDARPQRDWRREPMRIYEAHLGSWRRVPEERNRALGYRELAATLVPWVKELGFTHIELLPVAEHPFEGSWGYQVTGYFAPTARFGTPDDFRFFVDACHQADIGVLVDWVPAHFPKDDFALRRFDGTALFEHEDPRQGEHPDWGTLIFNYGRAEVRNFLVANALFWLDEFHIDGLRVDAVASMLYLDYSRQEGEWIPNAYGGRENLDAVEFVKAFNEAIRTDYPGCFTVAEESTAWSGVTAPVADGGLGFTFKWNMGWMHDTLQYFAHDPVHRRYHQDELTFAMLYEHSERFIMPLSHDEVVHGKGSLLAKMPGDEWQKLANLRTLLAYQATRPGKSLLFMGTELAPYREWDHDTSLDWHLREEPNRAALHAFLVDLGRFYANTACLWAADPDPHGFAWIDCNDRENSVLIFERRHAESHVVVVLNLTPVPREDYRVGAPAGGAYVELLNSDAAAYGGSGYETLAQINTEAVPFHGRPQSMRVRLPPLSVLVLAPEGGRG